MQKINLYRYVDSNGIVITPVKRSEDDIPSRTRLIADEGKYLTNDGINLYSCIDVSDSEGWYEVDNVEFTAETFQTMVEEVL